jgi:hypothetical protein
VPLSKNAFKPTLRPDTVSEGGRTADVLANAKHKDMDFFVAPKFQGVRNLELARRARQMPFEATRATIASSSRSPLFGSAVSAGATPYTWHAPVCSWEKAELKYL